jgi:hypothetical protein
LELIDTISKNLEDYSENGRKYIYWNGRKFKI